MAIGLALGRDSYTESVDPCYQAVRSFMDRFSTQYHALSCLELTGVHLGTPEGQLAFRNKGQFHLCTDYVETATRLVVEVLEQHSRS